MPCNTCLIVLHNVRQLRTRFGVFIQLSPIKISDLTAPPYPQNTHMHTHIAHTHRHIARVSKIQSMVWIWPTKPYHLALGAAQGPQNGPQTAYRICQMLPIACGAHSSSCPRAVERQLCRSGAIQHRPSAAAPDHALQRRSTEAWSSQSRTWPHIGPTLTALEHALDPQCRDSHGSGLACRPALSHSSDMQDWMSLTPLIYRCSICIKSEFGRLMLS